VSLSEEFPRYKRILPGLLDPEDKETMTLRNVGKYSPNDTVSDAT
jgi:hypothetical protein